MRRLLHRLARLVAQTVRPGPARIPGPLWQSTLAQLPFLVHLSAAERVRLKLLCEKMLATKPMAGTGGLEVSDEMAVLVAAQACLLVLNLSLELYSDMSAILICPDAFTINQHETDAAGVVHEWQEALAGEAIDQGGPVVLSWHDVALQQAGVAHNIVMHEFAHKIDMGRGHANGCPPFLSACHVDRRLAEWPQTFSTAYADFCARVEAVEQLVDTEFAPPAGEQEADAQQDAACEARYAELVSALPLDPYAARDPAEFFAVATEAFFVAPAPLASAYPQVFALLALYYRQNPLAPL